MSRIEGPVCQDCALAAGMTAKHEVFGMWQGICCVCGQEKALSDAVHDWRAPGERHLSMAEVYLMMAMQQGGM